MSDPILNLDQLTGRARKVVVERLGKRYELLRPEGLTLKQNQEWQEISKRLLQNYGPTAKVQKSAEEVGRDVDKCLEMICPAILAEEKPMSFFEKWRVKRNPHKYEARYPFTFAEKVQVLEFYLEQVFQKKVKGSSQKNRIGA